MKILVCISNVPDTTTKIKFIENKIYVCNEANGNTTEVDIVDVHKIWLTIKDDNMAFHLSSNFPWKVEYKKEKKYNKEADLTTISETLVIGCQEVPVIKIKEVIDMYNEVNKK